MHLLESTARPVLLAHEPTAALAELWDRLAATLPATRPGQTVLSGIEQALLDLEGKARGLPVWQLLGQRVRARVPLYANINRATTDRSPEGFATSARAALAQGLRAIKLAPFDDLRPGSTAQLDGQAQIALGIERVRAVRQAIGPAAALLVDCHSRLDEPSALHVARALEDVDLYWFEEPVSWRLEGGAALARVRQACGLRIATGESIFGTDTYRRLAAQAAADVFMPDVKHVGGIHACVAVGGIAAEHGLEASPHNPSGPVACAASLHAAAVMPACTLLEFAWGEVPWRSQLVRPAEAVDAGSLPVPESPGLGVELHTGLLANLPAWPDPSSPSIPR
jgi:galactonate dehydratase